MARGRCVTLAGLALIIALAAGSLPAAEQSATTSADTYKVLKADISHLNLVRGLQLTDTQLAGVLEVLSLWKLERESQERQVLAAIKDAEAALTALRKALVNGQAVPLEISGAAAVADHKVRALVDGSSALRLSFAEQVAGVLNENQRCLVAEFAPCLIPPRGKRDETRIGAPPASEGLMGAVVGLLTRVRQIPEDKYLELRQQRAQQAVDVIFRGKAEQTDPYAIAVRDHILKMTDEARALSDVDFELQKEDIARRIVSLAHPGKPADERLVQLARVQAYFLEPRMLDVLKDFQKERGLGA